MRSRKTLDQLLSEDIERCEQFLSSPDDEEIGRNLYIEIMARYDIIIENFEMVFISIFLSCIFTNQTYLAKLSFLI